MLFVQFIVVIFYCENGYTTVLPYMVYTTVTFFCYIGRILPAFIHALLVMQRVLYI
jgi:hypothetical protein